MLNKKALPKPEGLFFVLASGNRAARHQLEKLIQYKHRRHATQQLLPEVLHLFFILFF